VILGENQSYDFGICYKCFWTVNIDGMLIYLSSMGPKY